jgi:hypothetical protein
VSGEQISSSEGTRNIAPQENISSTQGTRILRLRNNSHHTQKEQKNSVSGKYHLYREHKNNLCGTNLVNMGNKNITRLQKRKQNSVHGKISTTEGTQS